MSDVAPAHPALSPEDEERIRGQLRLFAILHYVLAGIVAFVGLFPILHLGLGIAMLTGAFPTPPAGPGPAGPPDQLMGVLFVGVGGLILVIFQALAVLTAYAGMCLSAVKNYTFLMVVAAISLLNQPLGMVLGIMLLIWLMKPEVKALFELEKARRAGGADV